MSFIHQAPFSWGIDLPYTIEWSAGATQVTGVGHGQLRHGGRWDEIEDEDAECQNRKHNSRRSPWWSGTLGGCGRRPCVGS